MSVTLLGYTKRERRTDAEGNREYRVTYKVASSDGSDGPSGVGDCAGLPLPGSPYVLDGDIDIWAWCREDETIVPVIDLKPNHWLVTKTFSTKAPENDQSRCNTTEIQNPLLEPFKISGNFSKFTEEAAFDRFGQQIVYSSFEPIRGRPVEFDNNRPTVRIENNVTNLNWPLCAALVDCVNAMAMWGFPPRCVKLCNVSWERRFYGQCIAYYHRVLEFEIDYNTWDRDVIDESHLVIRGHWNSRGNWQLDLVGGQMPDVGNPAHYILYPDFQNNPKRGLLNGFGYPAGVCIDYPPGRNPNSVAPYVGYAICVAANAGPRTIDSSFYWIRTPDNPIAPNEWDDSQLNTISPEGPFYPYGSIVRLTRDQQILIGRPNQWTGDVFFIVTKIAGTRQIPGLVGNNDWLPFTVDFNQETGTWFPDTNSPAPLNIPERTSGHYNPNINYIFGDSVFVDPFVGTATATGTQACTPTTIGRRHIEKYREQDLFLLGIPAQFA